MNWASLAARAATVVLAAAALVPPAPSTLSAQRAPRATLVPFRSERELARFLREAARTQQHVRQVAANAACSAKPIVTMDSTRRGRGPANIAGRISVWSGPAAPGAALQGAAIAVPSLSLGTWSSDTGTYALTIPVAALDSSRTLLIVARRIGYVPRTQPVRIHRGDRVRLDIALCAESVQLSELVVTGVGSESITNTQEAGVDEGGIVKRHGDHLVILRRGRLFTVQIGGGALRPVAAVDAFGPGINPAGTWYDELLVSGDRVVVIGYSYSRGGTELGVFGINGDGALWHEATYQIRSDDYYSSRNYASRLVGSRLVLYAPLPFWGDTAHPLQSMPAVRKWGASPDTAVFRSTIDPRRVFRFAGSPDPAGIEALHTVTSCDLASRELSCESTVVLGPEPRSFYVSPTAVYVAAAAWPWRRPPRAKGVPAPDADSSLLYRLPLDGARPAALRTFGSPIDQFSFAERDDELDLVLMHDGPGDRMWGAEWARGGLTLLRAPLAWFREGRRTAPPSAYRPLPAVQGGAAARRYAPIQNRFVGGYLLVGVGHGWGRPDTAQSTLWVVPVRGGDLTPLAVPHPIDRIEALGMNAVVVGSDTADLHMTGVRLGAVPVLAQRYVMRHAAQGETRSHGFFYKPDPAPGDAGVLGLPVRSAGSAGWYHLFEGSASVLFVRNADGAFAALGELPARPDSASAQDGCRASCVDWYGNSRPLFVDGRTFALLGYELIEGRVQGGRVAEVSRISFAPRPNLRTGKTGESP